MALYRWELTVNETLVIMIIYIHNFYCLVLLLIVVTN